MLTIHMPIQVHIDHNLVIMKAYLTFKWVQKKKMRKRWDREKMEICKMDFMMQVDANVKEHEKGKSMEDRWDTLKNLTQAEKLIGRKGGLQAKNPCCKR